MGRKEIIALVFGPRAVKDFDQYHYVLPGEGTHNLVSLMYDYGLDVLMRWDGTFCMPCACEEHPDWPLEYYNPRTGMWSKTKWLSGSEEQMYSIGLLRWRKDRDDSKDDWH